MAKLRITYSKSAIGYSGEQKDTIRSLGLRKLNSTVVQEDNPVIRGMVFKVRHLVRVEEIADEGGADRSAAKS
jgi:large subunit ribosomal protein L30